MEEKPESTRHYLNTNIQDIAGEAWKDLTEFPFYYEVSTKGRLKSKAKQKIISQRLDEDGYCIAKLSFNGYIYHRFTHRLVAIAWIENPQNKPEVNHLKEKWNCEVETLEWATAEENRQHAIDTGLIKLRPVIAWNEDETIEFNSIADAARHVKSEHLPLYQKINRGIPYKGYFWKSDDEKITYTPKHIPRRKVIVKNESQTLTFDSAAQATKFFNLKDTKSFITKIGRPKLFRGYLIFYAPIVETFIAPPIKI